MLYPIGGHKYWPLPSLTPSIVGACYLHVQVALDMFLQIDLLCSVLCSVSRTESGTNGNDPN